MNRWLIMGTIGLAVATIMAVAAFWLYRHYVTFRIMDRDGMENNENVVFPRENGNSVGGCERVHFVLPAGDLPATRSSEQEDLLKD